MIRNTKSQIKPNPHPSEPGSLIEQIAAIVTAWAMADARGTSARDQWAEARRRCIPHARQEVRR